MSRQEVTYQLAMHAHGRMFPSRTLPSQRLLTFGRHTYCKLSRSRIAYLDGEIQYSAILTTMYYVT